MEVLLFIAGVLAGLTLLVIAFLVIVPLHATAGWYVNHPSPAGKSGFHMFTMLEPGQIKVIERGEKFVRMIMNTADMKFARQGDRNSHSYWKLEDSNAPENPVGEVWWPIRWWANMVYHHTGLVFTGIYPFQKVREYRLERTVFELHEEPDNRSQSNLKLHVKRDWSDHYRLRQFLFPMHVTAAETKDKIPLDIIGVAEMVTTNPYQAAYGTDRWDIAAINLVTDKLNEKTRTLTLDQALTAEDADGARQIAESVKQITEDELNTGMDITGFRIRELNPVLNEDGKRAIQAEAIALQKAKSTRIDGKARADALRDLNEANSAGGAHAIETMHAEAFVRASEAASKGGGTVILSSPTGRGSAAIDPTQKAILAELQKLNRKGAR